MKKRFPLIVFILILSINFSLAQQSTVELLNDIVGHLIGEQDIEEIPVFENLREVCNSDYFTCNKQDKVIGFNFQFANLNGVVPAEIAEMKNLEWINLEYNYLSGVIPEGLSNLKNLEQLLLNGNFIEGPLPPDLAPLYKTVMIDLSQNVIEEESPKIIDRLKIVNQVNLKGCRSPDSIYLSKKLNSRIPFERKEISIDTSQIETEKLIDSTGVPQKETFKVVETMPRFPGCETKFDIDKDRENCAKDLMLQFIYRTLRYPAYGRENGVEGMAVVQFVVLENGNIADVVLKRDPGGRLGNSGQWIVNRMNYLCDPWMPGTQAGRPVDVLYTLPIKFKLQ